MRKLAGIFVLSQFAMLILFILISPEHVVAQSGERLEYASPLPGSRYNSPGTAIAIRQGELINPGTLNSALFRVVGSQSGAHPGSIVLGDDRKTVFFKPAQSFSLGETVRVTLSSGIQTVSGHSLGDLSFNFAITPNALTTPSEETIRAAEDLPTAPRALGPNPAPHSPQFVTVPGNFPTFTITVPATGTADGYIFMAPNQGGGANPLIIMDNSGQPVYFKMQPNRVNDFQMQPNGWLTYWVATGNFVALDNTYTQVATYTVGNGYTLANDHDMQLLPNGHALMLIYNNQTVDVSQIVPSGQPSTTVTGCILQEVDTQSNVYFQWSSWDHFLISDTYQAPNNNNHPPTLDAVHCNAVEMDTDSNILLSSRHMSEITKIDRNTGDILWRLGGKNNQFAFIGDTPPYFTYQHDIRRIPSGNITLFDNGNSRPNPKYSRGVEYQLDDVSKTVTLTWQFTNTPDVFANATGDTQRQTNGNTLIDWGTTGRVTEVKPDASKAFEFTLPPANFSYRVFRFPWHGYPTTQPTLVAQSPLGLTILTYSWNGATDIASYRIYKGSAPQPTTLLTTQAKTGFETTSNLPCDPLGTRYYRVMPIDVNDQPTQYSNDVSVGACIQNFIPLIIR